MSSNKRAKFDTWSFDEPVKSLSSWNPLSDTALSTDGHWKKSSVSGNLVFVGYFGAVLDGEAKDISKDLSALVEETNSDGGGSEPPKAGSMTASLRDMAAGTRFVGVALGKSDSKSGTVIGKALASRCIVEASSKIKTASLILPKSLWSPLFFKELSIAFYSAMYSDQRFRGSLTSIKPVKIPAEHLDTVSIQYYHESTDDMADPSSEEDAKAIQEGKQITQGVLLARDIVNTPHNVLNSLSLASLAKSIAAGSGGSLTCQILDKDECEKRGMGAYLGVARASETPPQFIHLTYSPEGPVQKKVGVVGKGLLFDTGGYNIKTAMMELMKFDCGGAAAVLGAAKTIAAIRPPGVECHFVVAACENMINDKGIVPSDVLVASNGVTIEVLNTDAEGRLTLADALVYCDQELQCEKIIELSTLTGACMVALGKVSHYFYLSVCLFQYGFLSFHCTLFMIVSNRSKQTQPMLLQYEHYCRRCAASSRKTMI